MNYWLTLLPKYLMPMKKLVVIIMAAMLCIGVQAQTVRALAHHALRFNEVLPQENVYLHFDNTGYFMGETIWYKAYVVSSDSNKYTSKSRVLYVELLDPSGTVVKTQKHEIKNGQADGVFVLDDLILAGFYEVRAYTRYMTNWGRDAAFSRVFPIFKLPRKKGDYSRQQIDDYEGINRLPDYRLDEDSEDDAVDNSKRKRLNVEFYPEGGYLMEGLKSRVAFSITDRSGRYAEATGRLLVGGEEVATAQTIREGRGIFEYTPNGQKAEMEFTTSDGKKVTAVLPAALKDGCVMKAVNDGTDICIDIQSTANLKGRLMGLVVANRGKQEFRDSTMMDEGKYSVKIPCSQLSDGISDITLFDIGGKILADRLVFVYPKTEMEHIDVSVGNTVLQPYKPINLNITTPRPETTFSLAVRDAETLVNGTSMNAATWLLIGSELKGYIDNPFYYLEADDETHRVAADLLLMVQGWRKYDFEMMDGLSPIQLKQPAETSLLLMGQLFPRRKSDNVGNTDLYVTLYSRYHDVLAGATTTNEKGYYTFSLPDCYGTWNLVMQSMKEEKETKYRVGINRDFSPTPRNLSFYETIPLPIDTPRVIFFEPSEVEEDEIDMLPEVQHLAQVNITAKRYMPLETMWTSEKQGMYAAEMVYDCTKAANEILDKGGEMPTLIEWLKRKNPFIDGPDNISGLPSAYEIEDMVLTDGPGYKNRPIFWLVDNDPMYVTNAPESMRKNDVKREVSAVPSFGFGNFPVFLDEVRTVIIATKDPRLTGGSQLVSIFVYSAQKPDKKEKGIRRTNFEGFNHPVMYVGPDYSVMPPEPDFRRTLYWNPNVTTDKEGKATLKIYNNSSCKQIIVSAEAITPDGKALIY